MNRLRCVLLLALLALTAVATAEPPETHLLRYPDVSRNQVAFVYAGDLWVAPRAGGMARRLTASPGEELFPKFSPDGKWIAFTGEYDGNADVYVIPAEGGAPRRLTYHPSDDIVLGWTPDSKKVLFRSVRASFTRRYLRLFLVSVDGGYPEMLQVPRAGLTSFSPDGQKIAYNPVSREFRTWKRYRGGFTMYIGIFDLKNNTYEELPRANANDMFPMWHDNSIYFDSDRDGSMNLYRYDLGTKKTEKLTNYKEYDVKWPSLGADAIVYENGGLLYTYDLASGKTRNVPIQVASDLIETRPEIRKVAKYVGSFNLSPSGVRALFEARGDIFTVPVEHGSTRDLTRSPGVHELNPAWSPDGRWVAYLSDRSGEYEIYLRPQKGGDEVRVTTDGKVYRWGPVWSPDSKKLVYWDKKLRLWYVDIDQKQPVLVDTIDFPVDTWAPVWSPDSRWLAYQKPQANFANSVYLYSLEQKKVFPVTNSFYDDTNPAFDQNGKYLYFLSKRFFHPSAGQFDFRFNYYNTTGIFAVTLKADEASPFAPQSDEEKVEEKKPEEKKEGAEKKETAEKENGEKGEAGEMKEGEKAAVPAAKEEGEEKAAEKKEGPKPIQIDTDGIEARAVFVPLPPGTYRQLQARKEKLFYLSIPFEAQENGRGEEQAPVNTLHLYDVKARKDAALLEGINNYDLDKDGKKVIYRAGRMFGVVDAIPGKAKVGAGKLDMASLQCVVDPRAEWADIFHEAWRIERDFYWAPNMAGLDWDKIGKRYEALLPWVAHRSDLNYIIGEMIAELSTSHTYVGGGDEPQAKKVNVGLLGADYAVDQGFYRIAKIYTGENAGPDVPAPLAQPGLKVKTGDYIVAVNGQPLRAPENIYAAFQNLAGQVVTLSVNDKPSADGAWDVVVEPVPSESALRYTDWVEAKRREVDKATGGRVGYMHVPNTAISGLIAFDKYLTAQIGKEALIVDERYNSGGFIPDFYTEKLQRQLLNLIAPRDGKDIPWPPVAIYGPKVMLINEHAGSGGDAFPWYFKREKIGPLVGTRTWGGLVGISRQIPLMDGGYVTAPEIAFWSTDNGGEWIVENHGVDPDYVVAQRPDLVVQGHDPQLEKALSLVLDALKSYKPPPPRPPYPNRSH